MKHLIIILAQLAITKYHRMGGLNRHLILIVMESGKIKMSAGLQSDENTFPGS